jgi:predicted secreted Zn-dependent protease
MRCVRLCRRSLLLGAGLASAACARDPQPAPAVLPSTFAGVPNVTIEYYDVDGSTAEGIRASMNARRPRDSHDGQAVEAVTSWQLDWTAPKKGGSCDLRRAEVRFNARVLLPRLRDPANVPTAVLDRWRAFVAGLEKHEAYHVRHAWEHREKVRRAIRASSCAGANAAAAEAVRKVGAEQRAYDVATRHGASEVPPFP